MQKKKKLALKSGIQNFQFLTNDDDVCIPSLSSVLLAVSKTWPGRQVGLKPRQILILKGIKKFASAWLLKLYYSKSFITCSALAGSARSQKGFVRLML